MLDHYNYRDDNSKKDRGTMAIYLVMIFSLLVLVGYIAFFCPWEA